MTYVGKETKCITRGPKRGEKGRKKEVEGKKIICRGAINCPPPSFLCRPAAPYKFR